MAQSAISSDANLTLPVTNSNFTSSVTDVYSMGVEDTNWVLTSAFIIFTMQTGFGMLESGCVSVKNEVNIMMKNIVDIVLGGLTYWLFGYGMSFGRGPLSNSFIAIGDFLLDPIPGDPLMGPIFGRKKTSEESKFFYIPQKVIFPFHLMKLLSCSNSHSPQPPRPSSAEPWLKGRYARLICEAHVNM